MARRGLERSLGQTPKEFAGRVSEKAPSLADGVEKITGIYYSVRFGESPLTPGLRRQIQDYLRSLRRS